MISIFQNMLVIALSSSIMIIVVLLVRTLFANKLNIKVLSVLWLLVIIRLVLPVTFESSLHLNSFFQNEKAQSNVNNSTQIANEYTYNEQPIYNNFETTQNTNNNTILTESTTQQVSSTGQLMDFFKQVDVWNVLIVIWLIGLGVMFMINIISIHNFNIKVRTSNIIRRSLLRNVVDENRRKLKIKRSVKIYECDYIDTPVTYGVISPKILLPTGFTNSISEDKLDLIILHELCHIKKLDVAKNYLWMVAKTIYWFNPLLVHAYKIYLKDVELYCDEMVLNNLSNDKRFVYSQSLLDVIKISNGEMQLPIALSFCEDKTNLRKRVENMIKPTKKLKVASVISLTIAMIMIIACFTTACQPKQNEVVATDETENTEDVTQDNMDNNEENVEQEATVIIEPEVPITYSDTLEQDNVKVIIDAKVQEPEGNIPSAILENKGLTEEYAYQFFDYFAGDSELYKAGIDSRQSKEILEYGIEELEECLFQAENNWDEVCDHDPYVGSTQEEMIDYFNRELDELYEEIKTAPDEREVSIISKEIQDPDNIDIRGFIKVPESNISDKMAYLIIRERNDTISARYSNINDGPVNSELVTRDEINSLGETMSLSLEEAIEVAESAMADIGVEGMQFAGYRYSPAVKDGELYVYYSLEFYKSVNDVPIPYMWEPYLSTKEPDSAFSSFFEVEIVSIDVDESGVIGLCISHGKEVKEILDEDVEVLSFEDAMKLFEENIFIRAQDYDDDLEILITDISLSLMLIQEENGTFSTQPVWDFKGYHYNPNNSNEKEKAIYEKTYFTTYATYLTINAVDGTIIHR